MILKVQLFVRLDRYFDFKDVLTISEAIMLLRSTLQVIYIYINTTQVSVIHFECLPLRTVIINWTIAVLWLLYKGKYNKRYLRSAVVNDYKSLHNDLFVCLMKQWREFHLSTESLSVPRFTIAHHICWPRLLFFLN